MQLEVLAEGGGVANSLLTDRMGLAAGHDVRAVTTVGRAPEGEAYASVEGPKGELGFYLVSDGGISPYRCHVRAPSFINLTVLRDMLVNWKMGDLIIIFGSIDVVMGEVDR